MHFTPPCPVSRSFLVVAASLFAATAWCSAADRATVRVVNPDASVARPGEVIVLPFAEVRRHMPEVLMFHLAVKNARGELVPAQVTNFNPDDRRALYDDLVFQHDFAAGETEAVFTLERTAQPVPPFAPRVSARHVPERLDDFAWENDRVGHRIYGQALASPAGLGSRMISSGIDVWSKKVRYPIVDRWYNKGHDAYHVDTGEGLDIYSVGTTRGCGGTGVWEGDRLWVSHNWRTQAVRANGPIRAVFDIGYDAWQAGPRWVAETKRFTVDAGRNLDEIVSTFTAQRDAEIVVAVGIGKPSDAKVTRVTRDDKARFLAVWQTYEKDGSSIGCGIVLPPEAAFVGFAEDAGNYLILARVKSGTPLRYFAGACWDRGGDFADAGAWEAYLAAFSMRLHSPVRATLSAAP